MDAMQRLEQAVKLLIIGDGSLADRLLLAYAEQLQHIRPDEIPAELSASMQSVLRGLGASSPACKTLADVEQATKRLSAAKAKRLAAQLFQLSCAVAQGLYH